MGQILKLPRKPMEEKCSEPNCEKMATVTLIHINHETCEVTSKHYCEEHTPK